MDSQDNVNSTLRVASFSLYLNSKDEKFVTSEEGEIAVFGADKYFNMRMDCEITPKLEDRRELHSLKPKLRRAETPSTSSEESCNSQTELLPSFLRNPSPIKQKKAFGKSFFDRFGCGGLCLDKKSVCIEESVEQRGMVLRKEPRKEIIRLVNPALFDGIKESQSGSRGGESFGFPILNLGEENLAVKKQLEEEPRYSIEVFGSNMIKKGDIAMNIERKLSKLTWDVIPNPPILPPNMGIGGAYDDIQSDASSDLFEIETQFGNGHPLFAMEESEKMLSCMTPKTWYEPPCKMAKTKNVAQEGQKSCSGGLLGCKSRKTVTFAEATYETSTEKAKSMSAEKS